MRKILLAQFIVTVAASLAPAHAHDAASQIARRSDVAQFGWSIVVGADGTPSPMWGLVAADGALLPVESTILLPNGRIGLESVLCRDEKGTQLKRIESQFDRRKMVRAVQYDVDGKVEDSFEITGFRINYSGPMIFPDVEDEVEMTFPSGDKMGIYIVNSDGGSMRFKTITRGNLWNFVATYNGGNRRETEVWTRADGSGRVTNHWLWKQGRLVGIVSTGVDGKEIDRIRLTYTPAGLVEQMVASKPGSPATRTEFVRDDHGTLKNLNVSVIKGDMEPEEADLPQPQNPRPGQIVIPVELHSSHRFIITETHTTPATASASPYSAAPASSAPAHQSTAGSPEFAIRRP